MAKKPRKYFIVGLFVAVAFLITAATIIWINVSNFFEGGEIYVSYFDESVQGITRGTEVRYQGVRVGRVEEVRISPDNKTVGVYMLINLRDDLTRKVVAQLRMTGITGMMFVNLEPRRPGDLDLSPKIRFATEFPVIPSRPSEVAQILTGVRDVVEDIRKADIQGAIREIKAAAVGIGNLTNGEEMNKILAKTDAASGYLRNSLKRIDQSLAQGKLDRVLTEAHDAFKGMGTLMDGAKTDVRDSKIPETVKRARLTLDEVREVMTNLRRTSENLDKLLERLYQRPSDVIFGRPPQPRFNEKSTKARKAGR